MNDTTATSIKKKDGINSTMSISQLDRSRATAPGAGTFGRAARMAISPEARKK